MSANLVNVWLPRGSLTSPLCFYIQCAARRTLSLCAGPLPLISTLPLYSSRGPSHAFKYPTIFKFLSLNIISLETSLPATLPFAPFCQFHCNAFASLYCQGKKHPNKPVENKYLQEFIWAKLMTYARSKTSNASSDTNSFAASFMHWKFKRGREEDGRKQGRDRIAG